MLIEKQVVSGFYVMYLNEWADRFSRGIISEIQWKINRPIHPYGRFIFMRI